VYFVLENYPLSFNPEAAGFYKIATTNTYMANKYLKRIDVNGVDLIASEFLNTGDKFRFRVVYESCDRQRLLSEITVPNTAAVASKMLCHAMPSCKNVTATGTEYASLAIEHRSGNPIKKIRITAYDGDHSKLPAGVTIPYTLPESTHISNYYWYVPDLPQGKYTIEHTNECNAVGTIPFDLYGDPHTITWVEDCVPKLIFDTTKPQIKSYLSYEIQRFNEGTQNWERVEYLIEHSGSRTIPITGNTKGKFRLIRSSSAKTVLAGLNTPRIECTQVLSEKEFMDHAKKHCNFNEDVKLEGLKSLYQEIEKAITNNNSSNNHSHENQTEIQEEIVDLDEIYARIEKELSDLYDKNILQKFENRKSIYEEKIDCNEFIDFSSSYGY